MNRLLDTSAGMSLDEYVQMLRMVAGVFLSAALVLLLHRAWRLRVAKASASPESPKSVVSGNWPVCTLLILGFLSLALTFNIQHASGEAAETVAAAAKPESTPRSAIAPAGEKPSATAARRQSARLWRRSPTASGRAAKGITVYPPAEIRPAVAAEAQSTELKLPRRATLPAGTLLIIRTGDTLSTASQTKGAIFSATLEEPLVSNGFVAAEKGAAVEGLVVQSNRPGQVEKLSNLTIELVQLNTSDGQRQPIATTRYEVQGEQSRRSGGRRLGPVAAFGAIVRGVRGGGKDAAIPGKSCLMFHLRVPLDVTERSR